jgi:hypothetical protein
VLATIAQESREALAADWRNRHPATCANAVSAINAAKV